MPWGKIVVDDIVDIKSENERTIGTVLENLDKVQCMYTQMRISGFAIETQILQLVEKLDTEGGQEINISNDTFCFPYQSQIDHYNSLICSLLGAYYTFSQGKKASQSGIGAPLINRWSSSDNCTGKTTTYFLQFKQPGYVWTKCQPSCVVDNVSVNGLCQSCPTSTSAITMSIGCSVVAGTFLNIAIDTSSVPDNTLDSSGDNPSFNAFRNYLCNVAPSQINLIATHLTKNINNIDRSVQHINNLISIFDLI
jgi:hypothetical protein